MNPVPTAPKPKPLLDQVREAVRLKHYSRSTEDTYHNWVKRFILFHNRRHPKDMGAPEITAFLTHLAVEENVAASTQRQALSAIIFLYREVLQQELEALPDVVRAKQPQRLPVVLTKAEVQAVLRHVPNEYQVMAKLLYGSGLRLMECVRLRVKDLDFAQQLIVVRDGKGMKDRVTMLPDQLRTPLETHLLQVKHLHTQDLERGYGAVYLPFALERKYPNAHKEWREAGNMSSPLALSLPTRVTASPAATMWTPADYRRPSKRPCAPRASPRTLPAIVSATRLPPTCSKPAMTSGRCRSCWATRT